MYQIDSTTGETVFALETRPATKTVILEGFSESERWQVPMRRGASGWMVRLTINPGWFFYRFCVDGQPKRDRGAGKLRSADGSPWSMALINGAV